jgi:hypothetical protein
MRRLVARFIVNKVGKMKEMFFESEGEERVTVDGPQEPREKYLGRSTIQ